MSRPMTNYNERLDKILMGVWHKGYNRCNQEKNHSDGYDNYSYSMNENQAKQAITSLIKELVAEAKPPVIDTPSRIKLYADDEGQMWYDRGQNDTIARFEQNLLKELEEKK